MTPEQTQAPSRPFADGVADYAQAGWPCIIPVPALDKFPPPVGYTGADGHDTDAIQLVRWAGSHAEYSIALRMPDGVIGIDVDHYEKVVVQPDGSTKTVSKHGAETMAKREADWGPLPATWSSTARGGAEGPGPSRIMFYRVPPQRYATKLGADVEVIQRHHRYAVVAPSQHVSAGAAYHWYAPDGTPSDLPPKPIELPELPQTWIDGLLEGATDQGPAASDPASGRHLLDQLLADQRDECAAITNARLLALGDLAKADQGSRHDTMTARIHHLVQLAAYGHSGVAGVFRELYDAWQQLTAGEDRGREFGDMLSTSARKAVTLVGENQVPTDPCILDRGFSVPAPAPADNRPEDPGNEILTEPMQAPRWWSGREMIGAHVFDPAADLDQTLAQSVLERLYPQLRYAYDTGNWLLRVPDRWEVHTDLSGWAVTEIGWLMPHGDASKEATDEDKARASRRARLLSHKGAAAVSAKIKTLVAGGMHPSGVRLTDLDSEPDVLWAGGLPYDLRRSVEAPELARIDPSTPHLHSAAVAPERRPTPLWDAFLAAVWPDAEIRAWALRVMSVALTGYADRTLPILLGETGRGKTQLVHLVMSVLGSYAHAANPKLLGPTDSHDTIVYDLRGRRLSFIDEGPREGRLGQERLKQLTGGAELTANQMRKDAITFRPTHTLVLTANDEPTLTDPAIRARVRLIPCEGDPEEVNRTRAAIGHVSSRAWRDEAPGVLAQLLAEASGWLADPGSAGTAAAPESIRYLAEQLGAEQNPTKIWTEEEMEPWGPGTPSRELYQMFHASCRRSGMRVDLIPSETKWGRELTRLGYPVVRDMHGKRRGLRPRSGWVQTPTTPSADPSHAGLTPENAGFMPGSETNPAWTKAQVNPDISEVHAGYAQLNSTFQPSRAQAQAPEGGTEKGCIPGIPGIEAPAQSVDEPKPVKPPTKAQLAKAEERARLLEEAAGPRVPLPALVLRDGSVQSLALSKADVLIASITGAGQALTVDVETSGYPVGHQDHVLRTVQLGRAEFAVVFDPADPDQAGVVRDHLAKAAWLHAHSATADLVPLAAAGLLELESAWDRMLDTVIPAKLADPASTGSDPGLKKLSEAVLGAEATSARADEARAALFKAGRWLTDTEVTTPIERSGWAQVRSDCETMVRYAASDVLDTAALATRIPPPEPEIMHRERLAQRITARVAHTGLRIDGERVDRMLVEHTARRDEHAERIRDGFGIENPGSAQQVAGKLTELEVPLPRTKPSTKFPIGQPSVAEGVLEPLRGLAGPAGDLIDQVLEFRHHKTVVSLFLEPYHQLVHRGDGRARPTVYTLGADTGRMSCVRPNLQQLPREGGVRACITADPGHKLISADFSGVELRVAAALSQDPNLIRMLEEGVDLHWEAARQVFGPQATKADRYQVKRGVFGWLYGGRAPTLAKQMGVSEPVAQALIDTLGYLLPGVTEWARITKDGVQSGRSRFQTYAGRVVHMPVKAPHAGPNYCIQGTAREVLVDALLRWAGTPWGESLLFPVHDEVVAMVPEDQAVDATAALAAAMETELFGVRIVAEPSEPAFAWQDAA